MNPAANIYPDFPEVAYGNFTRINKIRAIDTRISLLRMKRRAAILKAYKEVGE